MRHTTLAILLTASVLTVAPLATYVVFLFGLRRHCREVVRAELTGFAGFATAVVLAALAVSAFPRLAGA